MLFFRDVLLVSRQRNRVEFNFIPWTFTTILCSLAYCGRVEMTNPLSILFRYRDGTTGKVCKVRVALQLLVKPGMYRTGPSHQRVDVNELLDQNLGTEDVEWYLLNQGSVVLTALLIKIEPI